MSRVLVIAEAGVNHNGDMVLARQLVDAAVRAGADIVKFQTFSADSLVTKSAAKADYQIENTGGKETQHDMLRRLELSPAMHDELIAHAREQGIEFMSTAFDTGSLNLLASRGLTRFKVPSGEITNLPYLRHMATLAREVIISTGMATLPEIEDAIRVFQSAGIRRDSMTVLHCTTEYPAPMDEVNLRAMQTIADACGVSVGYSDHTIGIEVAVAAVAMGARVIEKHLTLDCNLPGPDHKASLEPEVFREMVLAIRNIEKALGSHVKAPSPSELRNKSVARRSLVASRPIHAGEKFTPDNVTSKRPGTGLSPMQWDEVMGRTATSDFQTDECISL